MEIVKDEPKVQEEVNKKSKTKIEYDPKKEYEWKPSDVFYFSGEEFGTILHAFRLALNTKEAQTILMIEKASQHVQNAFERSVEAGISKPKESSK